MGRGDGHLEDRRFSALDDLLDPGDLLVFNNTRVIPARLMRKNKQGAEPNF